MHVSCWDFELFNTYSQNKRSNNNLIGKQNESRVF